MSGTRIEWSGLPDHRKEEEETTIREEERRDRRGKAGRGCLVPDRRWPEGRLLTVSDVKDIMFLSDASKLA